MSDRWGNDISEQIIESKYYAKKLDEVIKAIDTHLNNCKYGNRESISQSEKNLEIIVENYKKGKLLKEE